RRHTSSKRDWSQTCALPISISAPDRSIEESLALLAEQARSNALIEVQLDVVPGAAAGLDRARREAAYYIAADALGNIARHARAQIGRASCREREESGEDGDA